MQTTMATGMPFIIAAYTLTWVVLGAYALYVHRRFVRAERELAAHERGRVE